MFKHSQPSKSNTKLISYLSWLSVFFFVMQWVVYFTQSRDSHFLYSLLKKHAIKVPVSLIWPEFLFLLAQFTLYATLTITIWAVTRLVASLFKLNWKHTCYLGFFLWLCSAIAIVLANQVLFPASDFGALMAGLTNNFLVAETIRVILIALLAVLTAAITLAAVGGFMLIWRKSRLLTLLLVCLLGSSFSIVESTHSAALKPSVKNPLPNIIFIGVDSLRPDYTAINGENPNSFTPHLDEFLKPATVFTDATTPLARTFPSWVTILTGQYPIHNGVRFNLADQTHLHLENGLPDLLKDHGYTTFYATDDRRFSNISTRFGFEHIIGPDQGANDFILGTINDLPLSNLIVNTRVGRLLFPYSSGNRAASYSYKTQTFNSMVERALLQNKNRPVFVAVHFCLPHWPYTWSSQRYDQKLFPEGLYRLAVHHSDQQVEQFIQFLQLNHFLDHAIVVVLSDHGEAVLRPDDRVVSRQKYITGPHSSKNVFVDLDTLLGYQGHRFDTSYGHGSDVLSWVQFHTVFAIRTFGLTPSNHAVKINQPVAEIDIKPTILALLNLPPSTGDGISLAPFIKGQTINLSERVVFSESGFNPIAIKANQVDIKRTVLQGINVFEVNPSASLVMKPEMVEKLLPTKQRVAIYKNWLLAFYPQTKTRLEPALVNLKTGEWTDDLTLPFAKDAPLQKLENALAKLYGKEVTDYFPYRSTP